MLQLRRRLQLPAECRASGSESRRREKRTPVESVRCTEAKRTEQKPVRGRKRATTWTAADWRFILRARLRSPTALPWLPLVQYCRGSGRWRERRRDPTAQSDPNPNIRVPRKPRPFSQSSSVAECHCLPRPVQYSTVLWQCSGRQCSGNSGTGLALGVVIPTATATTVLFRT